VDVALTIHYYEAILACLAILAWHFHPVVFDRDVYPLNPAFGDGRVSEHWQQEEHPLEKPPRAAGASAAAQNPCARETAQASTRAAAGETWNSPSRPAIPRFHANRWRMPPDQGPRQFGGGTAYAKKCVTMTNICAAEVLPCMYYFGV
jgi:hypothetical protein